MRKTKLTVKPTTAFKKDYKLAIKRGLQIELLETVIETLAMGNTLPPGNRDHDLTGNWRGHRECHIQPDWLLIYRIEGDVLVLTLSRTGTHSGSVREMSQMPHGGNLCGIWFFIEMSYSYRPAGPFANAIHFAS